MAEQDLIRFLSKISQLQSLAERVQRDSSSRQKLADCADHNQVVQLAQSWGFDIGRRWGERDHAPGGGRQPSGDPLPTSRGGINAGVGVGRDLEIDADRIE
jgi:cupin 2 domain-containing protein